MESNLSNTELQQAAALAKETAYAETCLMLGIIDFLERLENAEEEEDRVTRLQEWLQQPVIEGGPTGRQALDTLFE